MGIYDQEQSIEEWGAPILVLGLSTYTNDILTEAGLATVGAVMAASDERLLRLGGLDRSFLLEVRTVVAEYRMASRYSNQESSTEKKVTGGRANIDPLPVPEAGTTNETEASRSQIDEASIPIERLGFTTRTYRCLARGKLTTVSDVMRASDQQLLKIRNMGVESLSEIRARIPYRPDSFPPNVHNQPETFGESQEALESQTYPNPLLPLVPRALASMDGLMTRIHVGGTEIGSSRYVTLSDLDMGAWSELGDEVCQSLAAQIRLEVGKGMYTWALTPDAQVKIGCTPRVINRLNLPSRTRNPISRKTAQHFSRTSLMLDVEPTIAEIIRIKEVGPIALLELLGRIEVEIGTGLLSNAFDQIDSYSTNVSEPDEILAAPIGYVDPQVVTIGDASTAAPPISPEGGDPIDLWEYLEDRFQGALGERRLDIVRKRWIRGFILQETTLLD